MNRSAYASALAVIFCAAVATPAFPQAEPAAPAAPAAPARAKFVAPIKGEATIEVLPGASKYVGKEIVTTFKVKNTSRAPIALLRIDEYWYDKAGKLVSSDTRRHMKPLGPGEIVELTTRAPTPANPGDLSARRTFAHANGKVTAKPVKTMDEVSVR